MWQPSGWRIVTSAGASFAVATGVPVLQIGAGFGAIYVVSTKGGNLHTFRFEAGSGGIGAGLPVSIAGSTADFPGGGVGIIMARIGGALATNLPPPRGVAKLNLRDLAGHCQIAVMNFAVQAGGAVSGAEILFNLDSWAVDPIAAQDHCRARGVCWGTSLGFQAGADCTVYRGRLRLLS